MQAQPNYLGVEGQAVQLIRLSFFLFRSLGSVSFSLDTHYKVNSYCAMGRRGETQGYPRAKGLKSHSVMLTSALLYTPTLASV